MSVRAWVTSLHSSRTFRFICSLTRDIFVAAKQENENECTQFQPKTLAVHAVTYKTIVVVFIVDFALLRPFSAKNKAFVPITFLLLSHETSQRLNWFFFFSLIVVFVYCLCLAVPVLSPVSLPRSLLICAVLLIIPLLIFSFLLYFYLFFSRCLPLSILIVAYNLITCNWNAK